MRTTHTFAELEVSKEAYLEIYTLLAEAGYHHAFLDGAIDMSGIALTRKRERKTQAPEQLLAQLMEEGRDATVEFKDGDSLPGGLVVSLKRGYPNAVYRCACGREQTAHLEGSVGGLSEAAARAVGWNLADGGWMCPFCSGDTEKLFQVFGAKG